MTAVRSLPWVRAVALAASWSGRRRQARRALALRGVVMAHGVLQRSRAARTQAVIAGLGTPSFVIVAVALTLTIAVLAGEVESRRGDASARAARANGRVAVACEGPGAHAPTPPPCTPARPPTLASHAAPNAARLLTRP
jgi:hypothetical protein